MAKKKLQIGVLFGGRSAEHEVSIVSARSVMAALDPRKYVVVPIGVTKQGRLLAGQRAVKILESGARIPPALLATLPPDPTVHSLVSLQSKGQVAPQKLDVVIPLIHGTFGEDGTVQGMLELAGIPYVGAGVLGSAVGMDKIAQKLIYGAVGLLTPRFEYFTSLEFKTARTSILRRINKLRYPLFVKPANLGSSVGISKVKQGSKLAAAVQLALRYDRRVLAEESIERAMEIEVAVLGNAMPQASLCGQIIASNEFYDYDAKYVDGKSKAVIPAQVPSLVSDKIRAMACAAFAALDLAGMARADFLVQPKGWRIYLNEVNTIPGFTSISMYPKLWAATGLTYVQLLDKLIRLALERYSEKNTLHTSFTPKSRWYRS